MLVYMRNPWVAIFGKSIRNAQECDRTPHTRDKTPSLAREFRIFPRWEKHNGEHSPWLVALETSKVRMPRGESFTPFLYGLRKRASRASSLRGGERSAETNGVASVLYEGKSGGGGENHLPIRGRQAALFFAAQNK